MDKVRFGLVRIIEGTPSWHTLKWRHHMMYNSVFPNADIIRR